MSNEKENLYEINHSYKEEIIVPIVAVSNNISFLMNNEVKCAIMGDGGKSEILAYEEVHICTLESDIRRLYNVGAWDFMRKWYKVYPEMNSMLFLKIKLKKYE